MKLNRHAKIDEPRTDSAGREIDTPQVSILMPTYQQASFIRRAIQSVRAQSLENWELIIVDDGSPDDTARTIEADLLDPRIRYLRLQSNRGLGAALNVALASARAGLIAYAPSDDVYYTDHLRTLANALERTDGSILAYAGVRHHYNRFASGQIDGFPLQLVQVMHRRTDDRWLERAELVTDDLDRMFWSRLRAHGVFAATEQVTCEWVDHPAQRHKVIQEPLGGINPYRRRFGVPTPLRFHSSVGNRIDEIEHYRRFRERPATPLAPDGLKIVLAGELAYNPERVLALEERGHRLYGLWTPDPYWFNTVGPVPFGHVEELPHWGRDVIRQIKPDVIYALLNWQAVPFVHHVLHDSAGVPFVWHFKEGPFICLQKGTWAQLVDLYVRAHGRIYSSPEMRDWFTTVVPDLESRSPSLVLDGDLPKREWLAGERSPRLSRSDGELHTVVSGRPIGLHPETVEELARQGIHLHFYGNFTQGQWQAWIARTRLLAAGHLHLHPNVDQDRWVSEFSRYDAGWLHFLRSDNRGELRRAIWDDLNYPARIATLVVAGLPLLQADNRGAIVATQTLARALDLGLFFASMEELRHRLRDETRMQQLRNSVWGQRQLFTFDAHADRLIEFFRQVIDSV